MKDSDRPKEWKTETLTNRLPSPVLASSKPWQLDDGDSPTDQCP